MAPKRAGVTRWLKTALVSTVVVSVALTGPSRARAASAESTGPTLKVISYNVQFLPGIARVVNKRSDPEYRARTIGRLLAEYDLVGLNETFDQGPRTLLLGALRKAWGDDFSVIISPKPPDGRFNGGCAIVSRLPFIETHSTIYSKSSMPKDYGFLADGFAAKGAIHARIRLKGVGAEGAFIDVFATHLESKDAAARRVQYQELSRFVRAHSDPTRPALILGDLNTRGNAPYRQDPESQYNDMMSILRGGRPGAPVVDVWPHLYSTPGGTSRQEGYGGRRIDYILMSNPEAGSYRLVPVTMRVNRFLDPRVVALSDHSAVEAVFRWQTDRSAR